MQFLHEVLRVIGRGKLGIDFLLCESSPLLFDVHARGVRVICCSIIGGGTCWTDQEELLNAFRMMACVQ